MGAPPYPRLRDDGAVPTSTRLSETGRVEAFSDGVFAIVLTLLVLDLLPGEQGQTGEQVLAAWPRYLAFLTAFGTVGSIWLSHHAAFSRIRRVDPAALVLNLGLLLATSLAPWPTALMAAGIGRSGDEERTAVLVYSAVTVLVGLSWILLQRHFARRPELLERPEDVAWMRRNARFSLGSVGVGLLGTALAFVVPIASIVLYLVVPGLFVVLTLREREPA
jgi:uncharacterized membrane protein